MVLWWIEALLLVHEQAACMALGQKGFHRPRCPGFTGGQEVAFGRSHSYLWTCNGQALVSPSGELACSTLTTTTWLVSWVGMGYTLHYGTPTLSP